MRIFHCLVELSIVSEISALLGPQRQVVPLLVLNFSELALLGGASALKSSFIYGQVDCAR